MRRQSACPHHGPRHDAVPKERRWATYPDAIERDYRRYLFRRIDRLRERVLDALDTWLTGRRRDINARVREDSLADDMSTWSMRMGTVLREFQVEHPPDSAREEVRRLGVQTNAYNEQAQKRIFQATVGIDPVPAGSAIEAQIEQFVAQNVDLITGQDGLDAKALDQIENEIKEALREGQRHETFADIVQQRLSVAESRAELIARDQLASLNGQLTQTRHEAAGIRRFRWQTAEDERVRPSHEALNGEVFSYSDPPSEGVPGTPVNCRCVAIPVFDD